MSAKGITDIFFFIESSASMGPCISGVQQHIIDFIGGLESNRQYKWDWRIDFVAHCASESAEGTIVPLQSLHYGSIDLINALYRGSQQACARFFTNDLDQFRSGLSSITVQGDEAPLVALDCCLDFPWRDAATCHRVVILLTDEPFETGVAQRMQQDKLQDIIGKIQQLRVMLFIVAPESALFDELASVDRSEYEVVESTGDGLRQVNFREVLAYIGRSLSVPSQQAKASHPATRGLFGQATWVAVNRQITGA